MGSITIYLDLLEARNASPDEQVAAATLVATRADRETDFVPGPA